jgi:hypothetical protein
MLTLLVHFPGCDEQAEYRLPANAPLYVLCAEVGAELGVAAHTIWFEDAASGRQLKDAAARLAAVAAHPALRLPPASPTSPPPPATAPAPFIALATALSSLAQLTSQAARLLGATLPLLHELVRAWSMVAPAVISSCVLSG